MTESEILETATSNTHLPTRKYSRALYHPCLLSYEKKGKTVIINASYVNVADPEYMVSFSLNFSLISQSLQLQFWFIN